MEEMFSSIEIERKRSAQASVFRQMYIWMTLALAITGITALVVSNNDRIMYELLSNKALFWGLMIAEIVLVIFLAARVQKMSLGAATIAFIIYSVLNGVCMSVLFLVYTSESIASTFFITAGTFGITSLYGFVTKKDLSSWRNLLVMALIGLIIASIVNIFLENSTMYWIISYAGVIIVVGLTAYDTNRFKKIIYSNDVTEMSYKYALLGALELYLDFVNMFIYLLRILGDRR